MDRPDSSAGFSSVALPLDEVFEMFLNRQTDTVLDPRDVGRVIRPCLVRDLVVCEALSFIVTRGSHAL